jgi:poly(3-hydroxyalkanoate) synthetase
MTAAMHRDFMDLAIRNALTEPGASHMLGSRVDLSKVDVGSYVVAGIADHLCKWESCYSSTQLLGGDSRFVLSTSGHIAAMVNPPGNEKASFQTADENPPDPQAWLRGASKVKGSWWDDYVDWLSQRTGEQRNKPRRLGSAQHEPLCDAPGTYVHDR